MAVGDGTCQAETLRTHQIKSKARGTTAVDPYSRTYLPENAEILQRLCPSQQFLSDGTKDL